MGGRPTEDRPRRQSVGELPPVDAAGAIRAAADFLLARQAEDALWRDFRTLAGESTAWVTGYVGAALAECVHPRGEEALERAARGLLAARTPEGGWGYHAGVPADADSTAYVLRFLLGLETDFDRDGALRCLGRHWRPAGGGTATYAEPGAIRRFMGLDEGFPIDGWCAPHTEVTAAAGRAFDAAGEAWRHEAARAWRWLRERQRADGSWRSYWWRYDLYPTAQAVALGSSVGHGAADAAACARAAEWAAALQRPDGGWDAGWSRSAFPTALGVTVLALAGAADERLRRGVAALIGMQRDDGSWPSGPALQIPPPHVAAPDDVTEWRTEGLGTAVVISDQARLYTTATAMTALTHAARRVAG